ncbi:MAG TPA: bifunctional diaminohydroxyphosphoribosylaminopyrimidine deaminase/5-amino-6-(5-phosphoribosylamino)uracil reductase, partial [Syntrophaceae bacterium]|nr:bifunctional diaminohydroxyphosphoribosylaminopyrimidine deaminase/5-amino-6-(5-phosphoribosylamino)uracil reductase [Syntrophaceae bacterium]HCX02502.1 bifunctional diaminohydroxyphosphoribosylaminopyrimidine deaminase/5-amino-6-(5-phosphoribosylamino)uracil reductase [Syntrophaceae bacterium]
IGKGIEAIGNLDIRSLNEAKILSMRKILKKGADVIIDSRLSPP